MLIDPRLLTPHPLNGKIYGNESISTLKERIASSQWIKPLVVTPNKVIISGHKRWRVALELGRDVPVEERVFTNELDELEALLLENDAREKTVEQKVREAEYWQKIEVKRALQRKKSAMTLVNEQLGRKTTMVENFPPSSEMGKVRDKVAVKVGFGSGRTYEKAANVVATADKLKKQGKEKQAYALLKTLNTKSVHKAYQEVKKQIQQEQVSHLQIAMLAPLAAEQQRRVEQGQLWKLGKHTLYCGDSASEAFIALCKKSSASFAFADPPYNAGVDTWDKDFQWQHDYLIDIAPIVAVTPGIVAIQSFMRVTTMPYVWSMAYWLQNGMTRGALGFGSWVYVALFARGSIYRNAQDFERVTILGLDDESVSHKGRKPITMMLSLVNLFSKEGQVVIDVFLGTGTTLIVCEQRGRVCVGAEINPTFCESIIQRWEKISGQKAVRTTTLRE
jgi:ParB-like chromosome segregation protein Spo0J